MLQIITLFLCIIIRTSYSEEIIYSITRVLNVGLVILLNVVMFNRNKFNMISLMNDYSSIDLRLIKNILSSLYVNKINITSCFIFLILAIIVFFINIIMFNKMFIKGIFTNTHNKKKNVSKNTKISIFNKILIKVFPQNNVFIYKDLIIFIRTLKQWDLILSPVVFTTVLFILVYKGDYYSQIFYDSMFVFLWISTNLVFNSIKSEGKMLDTIKNSTFNLKNIVFSKICYVIILSTPVLIILNIIILIFFKLSFFQWILVILISCISIIVPSVIGIPYMLYNYNLEDKDDLFRTNVEAKLYLELTLIFVPLYFTFKWISKSNLNTLILYVIILLLILVVYSITKRLAIKNYMKFFKNT